MSYGSTAGVEGRAPTLGTLSAATLPTDSQVTTWLIQASAEIDSVLAAAGYSLPVDADAQAVDILDSLADTYGTAQAIRARGMDAMSGSGETRSAELMAEYRQGLERLRKADLTPLGLSRAVASSTRRRHYRKSRPMRRVDGYTASSSGL